MIWKENLKNGQNVLEKWHNVVMRYYSHLFQMPPKKVKHGGARVDAGRKSLTGEYSNDKTMEEKKKADRNRKAKDIKLVAVSRIQLLGMNKVDRQRAEKTEGIQRAYNMAVAMLRGDV